MKFSEGIPLASRPVGEDEMTYLGGGFFSVDIISCNIPTHTNLITLNQNKDAYLLT
jgi:hypothetical protein